jgi:hypothetical protein
MDIARLKRDENIAEYILYIWQLEDLLRAMQFSPETVFRTLVAPRDATDEWKIAALDWYMEIAGLLQKEDKAEGGHLGHTLHLIADMNDVHLTLMEQPSGREYRKLFERLAPELPRLRETLGRDDASDIELAFKALYAAMLYRIKAGTPAVGSVVQDKSGGMDRSKAVNDVIELVSPVIALLSDLYHKAERGEKDLYAED